MKNWSHIAIIITENKFTYYNESLLITSHVVTHDSQDLN